MKTIKINSLELKNFKGLKDLRVQFHGQDTNISGDNATGKTTVIDAFMWLLFNKDSQNRTDFEIKTLDKNGEALHGLDHSVKGFLEIDGKEVILQKIYKENWVKKRGEAERVLTGNTTDYYIDEVPIKKSEFDNYIKNIMEENLFKLITNVLFFNEQLQWKERREILLSICGDVDDLTVIESNSKIKGLAEILGDNSVEELRAKIKGKKKLLNDDLKGIPVRIDEIVQGLPQNDEDEEISLISIQRGDKLGNIESIDTDIAEIDNKIMQLGNIQKNWDAKNTLLSQKKRKLSELELRLSNEAEKNINTLKHKLNNLNDDVVDHNSVLNRYKSSIAPTIEKITKIDEKVKALRENYAKVSEEQIVVDESFTCPTCKQTLPEDESEEKAKKLRENFEANKKNKLAEINADGKSLVAEKTDYMKNLSKLSQNIIEKEKAIEEIKKVILETETKINEEKENTGTLDFKSNAEYVDLLNEIETLKAELDNPTESQDEEKQALLDEKLNFNNERKSNQDEIARIDKLLAASEQIKRSNARIEELKAQERNLAAEIAKLEKHEFMTEEFIKSKVSMLEDRINSKFKTVNFRMFDIQVNGALNETCDALIKGVPFSNANNAAKINAGIDIINTLTDHYQIQAPIWIDNAESVNKLIDSDSQIVRLVVSNDKELKIENGGL